jgi:leucyl aminopeptidase (aminopeptidase T)
MAGSRRPAETPASGDAGQQLLEALAPYRPPAMNLAELGVGTNDRAMLTGNVLEDEKLLGRIHLAFGASAAIGGTVAVPIHLDVIVTEASLTIDGTPVLDQGTLVLDERAR